MSLPFPAETGASDRETSSIIAGGGWKHPQREHNIKIKAIGCLFLTILCAAAAIHYYDDYGFIVAVPSGLLLLTATILFCFERTTAFPGLQDGDYDIRNLYGSLHRPKQKKNDASDNANKDA